MKILKEGIPPKSDPHWWVNKDFACNSCNAVVQLEKEDIVLHTSERRFGGRDWIEFTCPCCQSKITADKR